MRYRQLSLQKYLPDACRNSGGGENKRETVMKKGKEMLAQVERCSYESSKNFIFLFFRNCAYFINFFNNS